LELKRQRHCETAANAQPFNRTILELKPKKIEELEEEAELLIEPYWN